VAKEWYIVNTFSGYENRVKQALEDRIAAENLREFFGEILVPSEQITERRGKRTIKTNKKFFPGYIFVEMELTKEAWHLVKNTPKVSGFLGGNTPRPVPQGQMDKMLGRAQPTEEAPEELPAVVYGIGEQVRVKSGAFANFTGEVEEVNVDKRKIWLSVSIFGRPTRVEVDFSEVEPAA
jgi:transcriptional antiterminator NusG